MTTKGTVQRAFNFLSFSVLARYVFNDSRFLEIQQQFDITGANLAICPPTNQSDPDTAREAQVISASETGS